MASSPITSWHIDGETMETVTDLIFLGKINADGDCSHEIKGRLLLGKKAMTNLDSMLKSRNITLPTKVYLVKAMVFPAVMYGCESWIINKAECQRIDAFELWCWRGHLRVPLDSKEIKPVNPKGNQSWIFIRRTDAETEAPILWQPDATNWLTGKDLDAGRGWGQEEKGTTEDEMVGWHQRLEGHEFEQALGVGDGQGSLACCSPWGHKELDSTEQLNVASKWQSKSNKTLLIQAAHSHRRGRWDEQWARDRLPGARQGFRSAC